VETQPYDPDESRQSHQPDFNPTSLVSRATFGITPLRLRSHLVVLRGTHSHALERAG
jgi:hypothetical protein